MSLYTNKDMIMFLIMYMHVQVMRGWIEKVVLKLRAKVNLISLLRKREKVNIGSMLNKMMSM